MWIGCSSALRTRPRRGVDAVVADGSIAEMADGGTAGDATLRDGGSSEEPDASRAADAGPDDRDMTPNMMPDMGRLPVGSAGCGAGQSPPSGFYQIDVDGTMREYHISMPDNYDASRHTSSSLSFMALAVPLNANWGVILAS